MELYQRINRNELLVDTNTSTKGSIVEVFNNPIQKEDNAYLLSRIGDFNDTDRLPAPGHCLHFDYNNADAYIQTQIPSYLYNYRYSIIIKGEGNIELLKPDATDRYIKIVQTKKLTESDGLYFDLSYIAFKNIFIKKIDYLFECEEGNGINLFDPVKGENAIVNSVTSLSSLRTTSSFNEFIKDEVKNLDNAVYFKGGSNAHVSKAITYKIPFSVCFTYEKDTWDDIPSGVYPNNFLGFVNQSIIVNNISTRLNIFIWKPERGTLRFEAIAMYTEEYPDKTRFLKFYYNGPEKDCPLPLGKHTVTAIFDFDTNENAYLYVDGVKKLKCYTGPDPFNVKQFTVDAALILHSPSTSWTNSVVSNPTSYYSIPACKISRFKIFNFDMSLERSSYTPEDYAKGKFSPYNYNGTDFTLSESDKIMSGDITTTLDVINTDGVFTFIYPPVEGGRTYTLQLPTDGILTNVSATTIVAEQTVTMTGDIDSATTPTTFSFKGFQVLCGNDTWQRYEVGNWGGVFRGLCMCKTTTEDLPEGISYGILIGGSGYYITDGNRSMYFLGYTPYKDGTLWNQTRVSFWIKRVTTTVELGFAVGLNDRTRYIISLCDLPYNEWIKKDVILDFNYDGKQPIAFAANSACYSGDTAQDKAIRNWSVCIAGVEIEPLHTLIDLENISKDNKLWLDKSPSNNSLTLYGDYAAPYKNYGTWCNAVGYSNDNLINPFFPDMPITWGYKGSNPLSITPTSTTPINLFTGTNKKFYNLHQNQKIFFDFDISVTSELTSEIKVVLYISGNDTSIPYYPCTGEYSFTQKDLITEDTKSFSGNTSGKSGWMRLITLANGGSGSFNCKGWFKIGTDRAEQTAFSIGLQPGVANIPYVFKLNNIYSNEGINVPRKVLD